MSTPVCLANAVCDALDLENVVLPMTPSKIADLIQGEEPAPPDAVAARESGPVPGLSGAGTTMIQASPEELWRALLDPEVLAAVIPGCQRLERVAENDYTATVSLGVGPVRGNFDARVTLSDLEPPSAATLSGRLAGPLGSSSGSGRVLLEQTPDGTRISYTFEAAVSGKVAAVGGRMLEGASRLLVKQFFERLAAQIGGEPPAREPTWLARLLALLGVGR
jgi:2-furoyl-CoA dehydrogenase large subunit